VSLGHVNASRRATALAPTDCCTPTCRLWMTPVRPLGTLAAVQIPTSGGWLATWGRTRSAK
jgi:hypothetical protein